MEWRKEALKSHRRYDPRRGWARSAYLVITVAMMLLKNPRYIFNERAHHFSISVPHGPLSQGRLKDTRCAGGNTTGIALFDIMCKKALQCSALETVEVNGAKRISYYSNLIDSHAKDFAQD